MHFRFIYSDFINTGFNSERTCMFVFVLFWEKSVGANSIGDSEGLPCFRLV